MQISKKLSAAVAGVLVVILARLGFDVPREDLELIVYLILGYLASQGAVDIAKERRKSEETNR